MNRWWASLRVHLALGGFVAIYVPVLVLFAVARVTEQDVTIENPGGVIVEGASRSPSGWVVATVVALAPVAAGLAWWLAGRAVVPVERVRVVAEQISASNLQQRIDLRTGPSEVRALAASFDGMLDRLQAAADGQRQFVEAASHELRTPLTVLTTNADVLLAHPAPTLDIYRDGLERTRVVAARLNAMLDALLVDARGQARVLDRQAADLAAIVADVVAERRELAATRGVTIIDDSTPPVPCRIDAPSVHRAVGNLVDNAIRHAASGTAVTVAAHIDRHESTVAVVQVTDRGDGVPPNQAERIFERFWSGASGGTGLGLPLARHVSRSHGGDVTVASPGPDGDGAVFTLSVRC